MEKSGLKNVKLADIRPYAKTLDGNDCECYCEDWYSLEIALRWLTEPGTDVGYLYDLDRKAQGRRGGA